MDDIRAGQAKEAYVESLFSSIASKYDLLNAIISLGRHRAWRRLAAAISGVGRGGRALDVCCGTGDFSFALADRLGVSGLVAGADFTLAMLGRARERARRAGGGVTAFLAGNALKLPFADNTFDCAVVGFGLRNTTDVSAALAEMARVVRPGGRVVSLEIFGIKAGILSIPWRIYFKVIAVLGARVLGARIESYKYLSISVERFIDADQLAGMFESVGLVEIETKPLVFGAVCIHAGTKAR